VSSLQHIYLETMGEQVLFWHSIKRNKIYSQLSRSNG